MGEMIMLKIVMMQPIKVLQVRDMNNHLMMITMIMVVITHLIHR